MEPQIHIKTEIKEEPIDDFDFNPATLIPKVEVCEEEDVNTEPITEPTSATSLSCPKCDITYYSAMSIKNHIQVCKKSKQEINPSAQLPKIKIKGTYILSRNGYLCQNKKCTLFRTSWMLISNFMLVFRYLSFFFQG